MRIAQVAPLLESVPPQFYGGTERIVSYLTEELVREGHAVTLFASGDSETRATLVAPCERALRLDLNSIDRLSPHVLEVEWMTQRARDFDVIHAHIDFLPFPSFRRLSTPSLTTLHGRLDLPEMRAIFREFHDMPVASVSDSQRRPVPMAHWQSTVYHGIPKDLLPLNTKPAGYLAFLGRISFEKRVDRAIEIAKRAGIKLRIAAKVDANDREYYDRDVKPLLNHPLVEFLGEIGEQHKAEFLGNARALLFPIDWPEPFGIVMIEAMACGTPVIAYPCGSVPEVITPGVTGFIVRSIDEAADAVRRAPSLSREAIRRHFEAHFTAERMAKDYVRLYKTLMRARDDDRRDAPSVLLPAQELPAAKLGGI